MPFEKADANTTTSGSTTKIVQEQHRQTAMITRRTSAGLGARVGRRRDVSEHRVPSLIGIRLRCAGMRVCAQRCRRLTAKMIRNDATSMTTAIAVASA